MNKLVHAAIITLLLIGCLLVVSCSSSPVDKPVTILHTNDIHSTMEKAVFISGTVNDIRSEAGAENVLLFDAGDVFSGTLYSTLFDGEAEAWYINHTGYDAVCPGNHEFDNGPDWLAGYITTLEPPVVAANLSFTSGSPLASSILPHVIIERGGARYGVFGLIYQGTAQSSSPGKDVMFGDKLKAARETVAALEKQGINRIIALTHQGWHQDINLAEQVPGIDIIIGGHTHTVPDEYPAVITSSSTPTLVVQAGTQGNYLGRLDVVFDKKGVLQSWEGNLIAIDDTLTPDTVFAAKVSGWKETITDFMSIPVGKTNVELVGERSLVRSQETNLGNAIADSMLLAGSRTGATLAIANGGGIRTSIPAGEIGMGNVMEVLPFNNLLVTIDITGAQLIQALENGVSQVETGGGRFPQIAGFRFTWNPDAAPGSRIKSVELASGDGFVPVELATTYRLVTSEFIAGGGDGYDMFTWAIETEVLGIVDYEAFIDYIELNSPLNPSVEGRITRTG